MQERLFKYIADRSNLPETQLRVDTPLFSSGILDSLLVLDSVGEIETGASIKFGDTEISLDNLDSVTRIREFVAVKRGARQIAS